MGSTMTNGSAARPGPTLDILRIAAGLLFMQHGVQKLFGWLDGGGPVDLFTQMGAAGVIETFGGLLIAVGLFSRPVAAIAVLEMIAAYFIAHIGQGFWPILNGGELALLYAAVFLHVVATGSGRFSLDAVLASRRESAPNPASVAQPETGVPAGS